MAKSKKQVQTEPSQALAAQRPAAAANGGSAGCAATAWPRVGSDLKVCKDYLDMEKVAEDRGLAHAGYLVLIRGEVVRLLYCGSTATGDADWLFGEVTQSLHPSEPVLRRGWLPLSVVAKSEKVVDQATSSNPPPRHEQGRPPPPPQPPSLSSNRPNQARKTTQPQQLRSPTTTSTTGHGRPGPAPAGGLLAEEAFPLLRPATAASGPAAPAKSWGAKRCAQGPVEPDVVPEPVKVSSEDRAKIIELQRAAAKKAAEAAAAPSAAGKGQNTQAATCCPICADPYSNARGRRRTRRPCCSIELCVTCDHKSLRSGKCYYCREASDEFPTLGVACRVLT